jgi:hypothetical protein
MVINAPRTAVKPQMKTQSYGDLNNFWIYRFARSKNMAKIPKQN